MKLNMDMLFGPLDRSYCSYFYYLEVMFFCIFVLMAGVALKTILTSKKYDSMQLFLVILQPLTIYFVNRLHYSMCVGSLKK
tara:strand:- start:41 stop:283 length:243 start_codon:yes stop_codon:yes gene_type:complete